MTAAALRRGQTEAVDVVHAAVPGRLRLRVRGRLTPAEARRLERSLEDVASIVRVRVSPLTGSILVFHDLVSGVDQLTDPIADALEHLRRVSHTCRYPSPPARHRHPWHAMTLSACATALNTDLERGLEPAEAARRLKAIGPNRPPSAEPTPIWRQAVHQFESLPVLLLCGSAVLSFGTGAALDGATTLGVVCINAVLGFVTEGQAERTIEALQQSSAALVAVRRMNQAIEISPDHLVPGDVIDVVAGMEMPADARLIEADGLSLDEAALTGESTAVGKRPAPAATADALIGGRPTMLHAGTVVLEGRGRALVVATGRKTEAAAIQLLADSAERPRAPVEIELDRLGTRLVLASLGACAVFFAIGRLRGYPLPEILRDAVALAIAAVPEGLPAVATTTLAVGLKRMERRGILIRQVGTVETLGAVQTICLDKTGTLTQNRMSVVAVADARGVIDVSDRPRLQRLAEVAALNNDADLGPDGASGSSPTERALLEFAHSSGIEVAGLQRAHPRLGVEERTPRRPWMRTWHGGNPEREALKGAPGAVVGLCTHLCDGETERPMTEADRSELLRRNDELAARPARVLALAERTADGEAMTFLGLVAMADPPRESAQPFIEGVRRAGIRPVLITGDQAATATALAASLGLAGDRTLRSMDAADLSAHPPELLTALAEEVDVFSRVSSVEKLAIVRALQKSGQVVAMTGDGTNDGPALRAADVGIAMGASGTAFARDVANVVIRDDELATLLDAVAQGRAIHRNIRRSLEFLITTNLSEIVLSIAEAAHGPGELETPLELLWINLVTDVLPGIGLALADPDPDVMEAPPRAPGEEIVPGADFRRMALDGSTIAAAALTAHFVGLARYGPGPATRGMTFLSLTMGQLLFTLVSQRRDPRRLRLNRLFENRTLDASLLGAVGLAALPFVVVPLGRLLGITRLGPVDLTVALGAAAVPLTVKLLTRGIALDLETREAAP